MPPRLDLLTKRWSTFDLPILPFLAPRVFSPWPRNLRSSHSESTTAAKVEPTHYSGTSGDDLPQNAHAVKLKGTNSGRKCDSKHQHDLDQPHPEIVQSGTGDSRKGISETKRGEEKLSGLPEDQNVFWTKYEEIWGGVRRERPNASPATLIRRVMCKEPVCIHRFVQVEKRPLDGEIGSAEQEERPEALPANPQVHRIRRAQRLWKGQKRRARHFRCHTKVREMAKVRYKFVRVMPEGDMGNFRYSASWNWRFGMLNARHDKAMKGTDKRSVATNIKARVSESFIRELISDNSAESIRERWTGLSASQRSRLWPEIMLAILADHPTQALEYLKGTFMAPYPPGYAMSDSLDFIVCHFKENRDLYGTNFFTGLSKAIRTFLKDGPADHVHLSQRTLFRLSHIICFDAQELGFKSGSSQRLRKGKIMGGIYKILVDVGHPMHENTLIQFASGLAKQGGVKTACEILQRLKDEGCSFKSPKILSLCSTLLQQAHKKSLVKSTRQAYTAIDIFRFMLEAGTEPNSITYNILMKNSLDIGDHETGWKIYATMVENGLVPDAFTYSILLNDAKLRMDGPAIRAVIDSVCQNNIRNDWIVSDILHAILLLYRQERQSSQEGGRVEREQSAFDRMLPVYCDHFHIGPLAQLIPNFSEKYPGLSRANFDVQEPLHDPPGPALVIMITGYLDNARSSRPAILFYQQFRSLLLQNDLVVAPLADTTHVWNLVLMSIGRFTKKLADCSDIVGDMLSSPDQTPMPQSEVSDRVTEKNPERSVDTDSEMQLHPVVVAPGSLASGGNVQDERQPPLEAVVVVPEPSVIGDDNISNPVSDSSVKTLAEATTPAPSIIHPPKPDVHTWSILLKIFMDHRQPRAAEKVLTMMTERQITPTQVTWNELAVGYARMQDITMTVDVLRRLEAAGLSADDFTMSALGLIRNRRALIDGMKRTEPKPELLDLDKRFSDQLKESTEKNRDETVEGNKEAEAGVVPDVEVNVNADGALERAWGLSEDETEEEEWW